ncbi:laccase-like [Athalia rosae]|uniref:laccase-like n=1 Tax=Athalia rosae TaxID=37344 RepID=UPI00203475A3|nr:laccase-like [Athalia rosae]XP_048508903.1 laccase-like [Athalia rosae]
MMSSTPITSASRLLSTFALVATSCFLLVHGDHYPGQAELDRDPSLSSPQDCLRACKKGDPPRICYYHFTIEYYTVLGSACELCTPNITNQVTANCQCVLADGIERSIVAVNRMVPGPSIQVCEGDKVVIDVANHADGADTAIHWHGILQKGTQYYDGVPQLTQCPIPHATTFRYQWMADEAGTYFWHSHSGLQKLDGVYGPLVVRPINGTDPNEALYDVDSNDQLIFINDWMHELANDHFPGLLGPNQGQLPDNLLINGKGRYTDPVSGNTTTTPLDVITVKPGLRYRMRMVSSMCTVCPVIITIEGHDLLLIDMDGSAVRPVKVGSAIIFTGERYDFVLNANQTVGAYWIHVRGLGECGIPPGIHQHAILKYEGGPDEPTTKQPTYDNPLPQGVLLNPLDGKCDYPRKDAVCISQVQSAIPVEKALLTSEPDAKIYLPFKFFNYNTTELFEPNTYDRFMVAPGGVALLSLIDGVSFMFPPSPPLSQFEDIDPELFCNDDDRPPNCGENCMCTHMHHVECGSIVEIVIVDEMGVDDLYHPFHLHGYCFSVMGMGHGSRPKDGVRRKLTVDDIRNLDLQGLLNRRTDLPPYKDTIPIPNNGYVVMRFRADNPGYWLLHCHFMYHTVIGMNVVIKVGNQTDLPPVPSGFPKCGNWLPPITPIPTKTECVSKQAKRCTPKK